MIQYDDPTAVDRELQRLQAVTADDVQRVLRQYVIGRPAVTLTYTQETEGAQG
jgi:zinc protease